MSKYIEFIKWCIGGISLRDEVTRMTLFIGIAFFGSLAFGNPSYWYFRFAVAIIVDLSIGMIQWKYRDFLREQENNRLNNG